MRKHLINTLITIASTLVGLYACLWVYDRLLDTPSGRDLGKPHISSFDLYPYSGFHMQANFHHVLWGHDVTSGPLGFWTDVDVLHPPPKGKDEVRVILIGGSGAQGQGDHMTNDTLLAHRLQVYMAQQRPGVRVINMAMGGTISYQNFVALNLWAHPLQPDLIVSYSGFNEWHVPFDYGDEGGSYMGF
ncbi:MAG TPA: hypothetical protein VMI56_07285, partial [Reyranella sp.]|nr:hypothetical protein [Reyranella sp.]